MGRIRDWFEARSIERLNRRLHEEAERRNHEHGVLLGGESADEEQGQEKDSAKRQGGKERTASTFDPNAFMNSTVETPFETKRTAVPANDYLGIIDSMVTRVVDFKTGARVVLDINWEILDDAQKQALNLQKIIVKQSVFLDFDDQGRLAHGVNQNVQLGQIREAVGQNGPGAWGPRMLIGAGLARLKISQRPDDKDPTIIHNDVDMVTKATASA